MVTRQLQQKNEKGEVTTVDIGALAENVLEDANHRFISDCGTLVTDWNDAVKNGWYKGNSAGNSPTTGYCFGIVIAHSKNYVRQILYKFANDNDVSGDKCNRYERVCHGGTWGNWVETTVRKNVPSDAKFTDTTYAAFVGATESAAGTAGLVPAPAAGDEDRFLNAKGGWTKLQDIQKKIISIVPTQSGSLAYTGSAQSPSWNNYDPDMLTVGGVTSGTNAGTYTATFTPKDGYQWSDGTVTAKTVSWTIGRAALATPAQSGSLTYTGNAQSPKWSNYNSAQMTVGGVTSGTNAGSYTAKFTPGSNYQWGDGTTAAKNITWKINKAAGSLSLSSSEIRVGFDAETGTVTAARAGDGAVTAVSSNIGIATVSVSGTAITVTAIASGTATITVKCAEGTNHTAPANKTISVTVEMLNANLADNTPEMIQKAAQSGQAANLWSVGDRVPITLNGTVGALTFNDDTYYAFIIGFNHNSSVEGDNSIHFQFGKTEDGTDIEFVDRNCGNAISAACFHMNTDHTNSGGWNYSYMRKTICPAFLVAMPTKWQDVIADCTKYSDNTGGGIDTGSYVTATQDKIWLLAEIEVFGSRYYANSAEQNYQKQYDYYKNGNSRIKYQHNSAGTAFAWWLRSARASNASPFGCVAHDGSCSGLASAYSAGFAPGFMVA